MFNLLCELATEAVGFQAFQTPDVTWKFGVRCAHQEQRFPPMGQFNRTRNRSGQLKDWQQCSHILPSGKCGESLENREMTLDVQSLIYRS